MYEIRLTYACSCVETWQLILEPLADDVDHYSPWPCPSATGERCRQCVAIGLCPTRQALAELPPPLEAVAAPIGPLARKKRKPAA